MENLTISGNVSYEFPIHDEDIESLNLNFSLRDDYIEITPEFINSIFTNGPDTDYECDVYNSILDLASDYVVADEWDCCQVDYD